MCLKHKGGNMKSSRVNAGGVNAWLHFAVSDIGEPGTAYSGSKRCVLMSVYGRSKGKA